MKSPSPFAGRLIFAGFVIDTAAAQLLQQDRAIELRPKSFEVLCLLAQNAGRVVSRDELAAAVWRGRVATDESIAQCISDIRRALSDADQRLLQTVPRRGYVLKTPVHQAPAESPVVSPAAEGPTATVTERPSIVVLPFTSLGEGARLDLLARGLSEDITTGLARYAQLFVIGRESAVVFGAVARDARTVGQAAGVRFVFQGSLRWNAGQVRITAKLVQAEDEAVVWADHFDGADDQLFAFQDEIVARIVAALVESVDRQSHRRARHSGTDSLSAYELFLQGCELRGSIVPANFPQAESLLERATALDPDFAPAYGELGWPEARRAAQAGLRNRQRFFVAPHPSQSPSKVVLMQRRADGVVPVGDVHQVDGFCRAVCEEGQYIGQAGEVLGIAWPEPDGAARPALRLGKVASPHVQAAQHQAGERQIGGQFKSAAGHLQAARELFGTTAGAAARAEVVVLP